MTSVRDYLQDVSWLDLRVEWATAVLGALAGMVLLAILVMLARRRRVRRTTEEPELASIDVGAMPTMPPPANAPELTIYGTPVRLAILVIAPVGRDSRLPEPLTFPHLLDQLVPGMGAVLQSHASEVVCWPSQLSTQGFVRSFFQHVRLPGDRGRETPWCSVAGRFRASGQHFLAGLVLCGARGNGLSQFEMRHEGQWNDALRIRDT